MFKSGFVLASDEQLEATIFNKTDVVVWQQGKILDYGGQIEKITEDAVTINGDQYLRAACEFKVR